jgi:aryl-alcohol dehydrogenase-like predicted oxidoreductase
MQIAANFLKRGRIAMIINLIHHYFKQKEWWLKPSCKDSGTSYCCWSTLLGGVLQQVLHVLQPPLELVCYHL